ncbi:methyl-accepting chemotaxis protein [Hydrogenophaga sp. IBVHS2]|uniref:methyl-accepting chemotaxis protein n=1 Tax=Hydrogenophaga sp. IBVHS2 TaxID=1985170 RepID=UPI000A2D9785|nr:methyl-accepting chemotaxis protein [Hydrogenophaga sp. IBVHS2]OSZ67376.1 methyl-accepting chemotaxis protein [Hydrogenophaga sp. IBVHS2]
MFQNLKISTRLIAAFSVLVSLLLIIGALSATSALGIRDRLVDITERRMTIIADLSALRDEGNFQARAIRNIALLSDPGRIAEEKKAIEASRAKVNELTKALEENIVSAKGRETLAAMATTRVPFRANVDKFMSMIATGERDAAVAHLFGEVRPAQMAYFKTIEEAVKLQTGTAKTASEEAQDAVDSLITTIAASVIAALLIAVGMAVWIIRSITGPLNQAVDLARAVSAGDLTKQVEVRSQDEVGVLMLALSEMQSGLVKVVSQVRTGSESVSSASVQIAQGNQDLSSRTESQASALEETAASMEELSSTVRQNADNAVQANQLARSASQVAEQGGQVVSQVVQTMKGIETSSRKIADIISVIDGIAFQTNILALNAAVEAARAGEQGRGFAVVAGEVRNLAQRSASAAKEIKDLITESVERVASGTALVDRAGSTMNEVVDSVRRVTDIMAEISAASKEQSDGVGQIGEAVTQMDQATQQNAALVEEMSAAASSLRTQAGELVQAVAVFRLAGKADSFSAAPVAIRSAALPARSKAPPETLRPAPKKSASPVVSQTAPPVSAPSRPAQTASADAVGEWESF